jgi:hypothetical protein
MKNYKIKKINIFNDDIGNVTLESDITLEFSINDVQSTSSLKEIPFQAQIFYTSPDSGEYVKVITMKKMIANKEEAERDVDVSIIALHGVQKIAKMALNGKLDESHATLINTQKFLQKIAHDDIQQEEYYNYVTICEDFDTVIQNLKKKTSEINDNDSKILHKLKAASQVTFLSGSRKADIVKKRKNHTNSKMVKNVEDNQQLNQQNNQITIKKEDEENLQKKENEISQENIEKNKEEKLCIICEENIINVVFVPCGHQIMCFSCSEQQEKIGDKRCPNCRAEISMRIKTFGK